MPRLRHCEQVSKSNGCAIACVAIVSRCSYHKASKAMFGKFLTKGCEVDDWNEIKRALASLKVSFKNRAHYVTKLKTIRRCSIVWYDPGKYKHGHVVVYAPEEDLVYDPLKSKPVATKDYRIRKKPISYLEVKARSSRKTQR